MNRDGIPNATGEEWEWYSEGPDHTAIRAVYEKDPDKWDVWYCDDAWFPVLKGARNLAWYRSYKYRMKRRQPAEWPKWDKVDPVSSPREKCGNCRFWAPEPGAKNPPYDLDNGECRRRSSRIIRENNGRGLWPRQFARDWCGEWGEKDAMKPRAICP